MATLKFMNNGLYAAAKTLKTMPHGSFNLRRDALAERTVALARKIKLANTSMSQLLRIGDLCRHLTEFPETRSLALKENIVPLLKLWREQTVDQALSGQINECLALLGCSSSVKGRGLMALEVLQAIEALCPGYRIHQMFDYVVGVSTGAIIGALVAGLKLPIPECKQIYRAVSVKLFTQSRVRGSLSLLWSHSYYDTSTWVRFLQQSMGEKRILDTAHTLDCPKLGFISCVVNKPQIEPFVHKNYHYPVGITSYYPGSCKYKLWEALQASSAAPGYFEECRLDDAIHQDGGVLVNNPAAIGLHECKLIWPNTPVQCIVSIGNGRSASVPIVSLATTPSQAQFSSTREKLMQIVNSATDTEMVHHSLNDLLSPYAYFRFNPYVTLPYTLDTSDPKHLTQMEADAKMYIRKNHLKFQAVATSLMQTKPFWRYVLDRWNDSNFMPYITMYYKSRFSK